MMDRAVDCNDCYHLSITEKEQTRLKSEGKPLRLHVCLKYNKTVYHRARTQEHDSYLYPCDECVAEMNRNDGESDE